MKRRVNRRVKRLATSVAAAFCLVLTAAVPVLWVRSHDIADRGCGNVGDGRYLDVVSVEGGIEVRYAWRYAWREPFEWFRSENHRRTRTPWYALGFAFRRDFIRFMPLDTGTHPPVPPAPYVMVRLPYGFLLALSALYPAARARGAWRARVARRRREQGLCVNCGYDVRASRERCPECGTAFAQHRQRAGHAGT